jgi:DNA-binding Lrp family transcriptional regulator
LARKFLYDELDYQIISELKKDARASAAQIANALDVAGRTVRRRIDRLVENNVVRFSIYVDPTPFGYVVGADVFIEVSLQYQDEVMETLLGCQEVVYLACGRQPNSNEISLHVNFKNNEQLFDFIYEFLPSLGDVKVKSFAWVPRVIRMMHHWTPQRKDFFLE